MNKNILYPYSVLFIIRLMSSTTWLYTFKLYGPYCMGVNGNRKMNFETKNGLFDILGIKNFSVQEFSLKIQDHPVNDIKF